MSYYDDSSLFVAPNGYKASVLFAQKPMDANGQLAFTRSNDTATRVASNGLIEKVRINYARQSQSFATAAVWTATSGTLTNNAGTAPDGTNTASKIVATNTDPFCYQSITLTGPVVASCYVRAIGSAIGKSAEIRAGVSITTFTLSGSWQRVSVRHTASGAHNYGLEVPNPAVIGDEVLLWGFQVEGGDVVTDYIATTTAAVSVGPLANIPRIDYLGGGCGKLLLEPQRTNVITFSEQMNNAAWTKTNTTITANATTAPDGYLGACKSVPAVGQLGVLQQNHNITAGQANTISIFAKAGERSLIALNSRDNASASNAAEISFNLSTGVISIAASSIGAYSAASGTITNYGNGWYRLTLTHTSSISTTTRIRFIPSELGDGTKGLFVWGAQFETNSSYASSYVNTLAASVTRGADACSKTGISSLIGQTEGTLFLEFDYNQPSPDINGRLLQVYATNDTTNAIVPLIFGAGANVNQFQLTTISGGGTAVAITASASTVVPFGRQKFAIAYNAGAYTIYRNGSLFASGSGLVPASLTAMDLGGSSFLTRNLCNPINQALLFKTRLPNSELASLTTL